MFDAFKTLFTSTGEALYYMRIADAYQSQPTEMREALTKAISSHYPVTPVPVSYTPLTLPTTHPV